MKEMILDGDDCVLATCRDGQPHCSLMRYLAEEGGESVIMISREDSRKYLNMRANPSVSLLIDTRASGDRQAPGMTRALTAAGRFEPVGPEDVAGLKKRLLARRPELSGFFRDPGARVFRVRLLSLQLLDGLTDAHFRDLT